LEVCGTAGLETCATEHRKAGAQQRPAASGRRSAPTLPKTDLRPRGGLILDYLGLPWITLDYLGLPWITLDYPGLPWIILDYLGLSWIILDYLGLPWITLDYLGFARVGTPPFQLSAFSLSHLQDFKEQ
jgi:hypothetical protein